MNEKKLMMQYSALQGCYWMLFGTVYSFATVYLLARGFDSTGIGICIAVGNICGVILQPVFAGMADRSSRITVQKLTAILAGLTLLALLLQYAVPDRILPVAALFIIADALLQVLQPLVNSVSVYYINRGVNVDFGIARGIGSLCYAIISSVLGALIARSGSSIILAVGSILLAVMIILLCRMPVYKGAYTSAAKADAKLSPDEKTEADAAQAAGGEGAGAVSSAGKPDAEASGGTGRTVKAPGGFIRRYPYVCIASIGLTLLMMNHNMQNSYQIQIITPLGGDSVALGNTLAIAAVMELPTMFLFSRMVKRISSSRLVMLSGVFFFAKAVAYLFCGNMTQMYAAQVLQMGAFALYIPATVYYVNEVMDPQDTFRGQALMAGTSTLGGVFGSLIGGLLIDYLNVRMMLIFGTIIAFIGMLTVFWAAPKAKGAPGKC